MDVSVLNSCSIYTLETGGSSGAMRELIAYVDRDCGLRTQAGENCTCAGGALLLAAADALAGRGAGGRALPDHAQPSARHDALLTLLAEDVCISLLYL